MDNSLNIHNRDFIMIGSKIADFQIVHNELRKGFLLIYDLAITKSENEELKPLIRACYKEMFSLIEADIYLLNQFNPYPDYNDKEDLITKFKETFKQHSKTFNKGTINLNFNNSSFFLLKENKKIRDELTHPKERKSIDVDISQLEKLYCLYQKYNDFVAELMTNIVISTNFNSLNDLEL